MIGTTYIWLNSSSVATDEYTHARNIHFKARIGRDYYVSDSTYKTLNTIQDGGILALIGTVAVLGLMKVANKDGGNA